VVDQHELDQYDDGLGAFETLALHRTTKYLGTVNNAPDYVLSTYKAAYSELPYLFISRTTPQCLQFNFLCANFPLA